MTVVTVSPRVTQVTISRGPAGVGVPTGGATAQVLRKTSATDYDAAWSDPSVTAAQISDSTAAGRSLLTAADAAAQRTALSVPSVAEVAAGYQPLDADLTAIAALTTTSYGRSLLTGADAAATRTLLGLAAIAASGSASDLSAGTVPAARMPAHTGDVTSSAGSVALTVGAGAVTLAKMANLAANSIIGNNTGSAATPIALTAAQTRTLLGLATVATSGSASDLSAGTLADARLSANIPLLNSANAFSAQQSIDLGSGALPASYPGTVGTHLRINGADGNNVNIAGTLFGNSNGFTIYGQAYGGTRASPTAIADAVAAFGFAARGFDGTNLLTKAGITCLSDGAWSGSSAGMYWTISGTPNGSTTMAEWARFYRSALLVGATSLLGSERLRVSGGTVATSGATDVNLGGGSIDMGTALRYRGVQVIGARRTGWTAQTATASRADLGASPTVGAIASFLRALYDDLAAHGAIGT